MNRIGKMFRFEAAHRITGHPKCGHLHGHSYRMEIVLRSETLNDSGMVIDFGDLSERMRPFIEMVDHSTLLSAKDPGEPGLSRVMRFPGEPTAEVLAEFFFKLVRSFYHPQMGAIVESVRVWETETSWAMYGISPML